MKIALKTLLVLVYRLVGEQCLIMTFCSLLAQIATYVQSFAVLYFVASGYFKDFYHCFKQVD